MSKPLLDAAKNLWRDKNFVDFHITVGTTKLYCHKVILANASVYFNVMFLNKSLLSEYIMADQVKEATIEKCLEYIYTYDKNTLNATKTDTIIEMFKCGNLWLVPSLQEDCQSILVDRADTMEVEGLIDLFELGHNYNNETLIKEVTAILLKKQVKHMFCDRALRLGNEVFACYLAITSKYMREIRRYKMIESYLELNGFLENLHTEENSLVDDKENLKASDNTTDNNLSQDMDLEDMEMEHMEKSEMINTESGIDLEKNECQKRRDQYTYVKELFRQINFSVMSGDEFYEGPGTSKFLTLKFKYEKLYRIQCSRIRRLNNLLNHYRAR